VMLCPNQQDLQKGGWIAMGKKQKRFW
jgi:hypothetical protein